MTTAPAPAPAPIMTEVTPEVIAWARSLIAQVDGPPPPVNNRHFGIRYLFNVRTRRIHNRHCRSVEGSVPLTGEEIEAACGDRVYGCLSCGTTDSDGMRVYDYVMISPTGEKEIVSLGAGN